MRSGGSLCALLLALPALALAHSSTQSFSEIDIGKEEALMRLRTRDADLAFVLHGIDLDDDGALSGTELSRGREAVAAYFLDKCEVRLGGKPCRGEFLGVERVPPPADADSVHATNLLIRLRFPLSHPGGRLALRIHPYDDNDPLHQHVAMVSLHGGPRFELFLHRKAEPVLDIGIAEPPASRGDWVGGIFRGGVLHILAGWDHLLFLAALILVVERPWAVLGVVTGFTVGHTLTLVLAGLDLVTLPARLTEGAIAFSIAWVGVRNALGASVEGRWRIAALFGLVHGFGFASGLRGELPQDRLLPSLLVFNLGIEAGQLGVVALVWPALRRVSRRPGAVRGLSWAVAAIGAGLCASRFLA